MSIQGPGKPGFSVNGALSSASLEDVVPSHGDDDSKTRVHSDSGSDGGDAKLPDLEAPKSEPTFTEKDSGSELPDPDEQSGVKRVEAVTLTWSKKQLYLVYANMWMIYCVNAFQNSVTQNLSAYVTSEFGEHSLLPVAYIVASAISAAVYLPTAKILDIFGRAEGFAFMASIATLGLILTAACKDVQTFAAAQTFYSVGFGGMIYCVDVITADTSTLKHRGFAYAFTSSPYIITAFAGPPIAESAYYHFNWRWGYGIFSIILPVVALPMVYILKHTEKLAKDKLAAVEKPSPATRSRMEKLWYYLIEFDVLGVFLFAAGLTIFLLPFTLADSAPNGWSSGYIIAMLVLGFVLLVSFAFFERYFAKVPCLPFGLLTSRTIFATVMLDATVQVAYYCWNNYYTSFLQVVYDVSITNAGYVGSTYDVVSGLWLFFVGVLIAKTGYFKWLLVAASLIYTFAIGLMIHFRTQYTSIGYLFMCQVFIAFGASTVILVQQVSVLAASDHQHTAAVLALLNVFGWLGGSIGSTISGAIWTNTFEKAIIKHLPDLDSETIESIYGSLDVQLSYPVGDPVRTGLIAAYSDSQRYMLIAGVCICATTLPWALLIKNINVSKIRQMKGTLF